MKLLLLDKDGTLIRPKSGAKFVNEAIDQEPLPGVENAIAHYHSQGWKMVIISNQAGVAAGHKSLKVVIAEMRFCLELFPQIEEAYFCPDFDGLNCYRVWADDLIHYQPNSDLVKELGIKGKFRKPGKGMLVLAKHIHAANEVIMTGDRPEDEHSAIAAGINFVWADVWRIELPPLMG